jgi:hypothetical protein
MLLIAAVCLYIIYLFFFSIEIDMYTMKEFGRLAKEEPEAYVMVCDGIQYNEEPALPGQDPLWLKKIYKDVNIYKHSLTHAQYV